MKAVFTLALLGIACLQTGAFAENVKNSSLPQKMMGPVVIVQYSVSINSPMIMQKNHETLKLESNHLNLNADALALNQVAVQQTGAHNDASIIVKNTNTSTLNLVQIGSGNSAILRQLDGLGLALDARQQGSDNGIEVSQSGNASKATITQTGKHNSVVASQIGANTLVSSQTGANNSATITQR